MKNNKFLIASAASVLLVLVFAGCKSVSHVGRKADRSIVVLYENDVHCAIDGYALLAGLRDQIADTAYVAVVSNGDYLQGASAGAISKGGYIIDIMNSVGYDAVTLGNHEFDYKTPRMLELMQKLSAPVTCVNLYDTKTRQRVFLPSVVKQYGKRKIGFVGAVTPATISTEQYAFFDDAGNQLYELKPTELNSLIQQSVDQLRREGVDYVVVLSHLGEADNDLHVSSHTVIQATNGIDALLDGHTHSTIPCELVANRDGRQVIVSETGTKFANIGKLLITPDGHISTQLIPAAELTAVNSRVKHTTDSIKTELEQITNRVVCQSDAPLTILDANGRQEVRFAETNAGDIVTDAYRYVTGAQIGLSNGGGIRTNLPAGNLTYGDMVSLLPFDNNVCMVEITGAQLVELLTRGTHDTPRENGDFPQSSGIRFTVHTSTHTISDLTVLNPSTGQYEPVQPDKVYTLATIDYCVTGGGFFGILKNNKILKANVAAYSECLIRYVTEKLEGHIGAEYAKPQGRITIVE